MPLRVNASALAKATGLTKARVSQLKSKGIIAPDKRGQYDLEDASNRIGRPVDLEQEASENLEEIKVVDFGKWRTFKMREDALHAQREDRSQADSGDSRVGDAGDCLPLHSGSRY